MQESSFACHPTRYKKPDHGGSVIGLLEFYFPGSDTGGSNPDRQEHGAAVRLREIALRKNLL